MQLTCPECGKEFEIEESQQAHEKQAAALKAQEEEAKIETQRLLEDQKKQLAKDQQSIVDAAVKKQVEDELNESRAQLINQAKEEAEQKTQKLLEDQKKQLVKDQESIVEAAVKQQVEENQAAALKEMEQNYQQQFHETLEKAKRDNQEMIERKESEHKIEKDRLTLDIAKLNDRLNRTQESR